MHMYIYLTHQQLRHENIRNKTLCHRTTMQKQRVFRLTLTQHGIQHNDVRGCTCIRILT